MEEPMRRTGTDKQTSRKKSRAIHLAASALAVTATFAGAAAQADHKGYDHNHHKNGYGARYSHHQDRYRHGPMYWKGQQNVRVHIPVRDHGPETLPLGRLIARNSNIDLDRYRLVAVVTKNGRFSNGYASLRTGNSKTHRYFLGSRENTWIPAPSRADRTWRLRLGPGAQVRSVTAVLEPRRGWANSRPTQRRHASDYRHNSQPANGVSRLSLAWMLANAEDNDGRHHHGKQARRVQKLRAEQAQTEAELADTQRKLERSRERNKRLKDQRARLAEELAHERAEDRAGKRGQQRGQQHKYSHKKDRKQDKRKAGRQTEREVKRTVRYVVSAS
jgi:hypothetical protein